MNKDLPQISGFTRRYLHCLPAKQPFRKKLMTPCIFMLSWLLLLTLPFTGFSQTTGILVKGKVADILGNPLPGASIKVKGTATGVSADVNGNYILQVPDASSTLEFSSVGYASQEILLNGRTALDIRLTENSKGLNEVVVIGYQSVRKKDLTGAVSVVNTGDAGKVTSSGVAESLQGLSPGVNVRTSGAPGQQAAIEIRGIASFISAAPLYVIDGMIADANPTLNNDDIESIQILKDASASAIYGSRAANGVVIITTKKGRNGPAKISLSVKYGVQKIPKQWDMMNSTQYAALKSQAYTNSGLPVPASIGSAFNPAINTDWQSLEQRTGNDQDYNLTLSGGTEQSKYLISGSYYNNKGVLQANSFNRASLRINTETKKGIMTFGENAVFTNSNYTNPNRGNPFFDTPQSLPTIPVQSAQFINTTGNFNPMGYSLGTNDTGAIQDISYANNMIAINDLSKGSSNFGKLVGNAYVDLKLTDWLSYRFNAGLEVSFDFTRDIRKDGVFRYGNQPELSYVDENRQRFTNLLLEHTLNFNKTLGKHVISGVVGYTQQSYLRTSDDARRTGLAIYNGQYLTQINSATGTSSATGLTIQDDKLHSFLGRLNYTYDDKYLLTLTARDDQDSRFGAGYRNGFFPSVAAAWRINKEGFFKADWVNDLKLNASYGRLGINTITSFQNVGFINNSPRAVFGPGAQNTYVGAYQATLANTDLRWEKRTIGNIGVDASFFHDALSVSVAAYNSLSEDVLINLPLGQFLGNANGTPPVNAGSIRNRGLELEATYRNNTHPFKYSISGNLTTIQNRVMSVGNQGKGINYLQQGSTRSEVGYGISQWYVLKDMGLFQSQDEINNYKRKDGSLIEPYAKPGDVKFYAKPDGTGSINSNDRVFMGSPLPTLQAGLQFNTSYKGFSLNLQLVGTFGFTIYNGVRSTLDSYQNTNFRTDVSPWTPGNTNTSDPRIGIASNDPGISSNNTPESSRWLESGSYVRIRNLEIGYQLPKSTIQHLHVDNARIFIAAQNLLTFTGYSGLDPDITGNGLLQPGVDNGNWPPSRIFSLGLNFGF